MPNKRRPSNFHFLPHFNLKTAVLDQCPPSFLPRDSYAKRGICRRRVSVCVCVCVCVSVTLRYCIKKAKHRITQIMPHASPGTPKFTAKFERDHPLRGRQIQVGWVKIRHFRRKTRYNTKTVQDIRIVFIKVE